MMVAMTNWMLPSFVDAVLWWAFNFNIYGNAINSPFPGKPSFRFLEIVIDEI